VLTEAEDARLSALTKFRLAVFILSGRFPRRGELVVQRLAALMRLRNSLMHLHPDPLFTIDESFEHHVKNPKPPPEVALLLSEGVISLPENYSGSWRQLVANQRVAHWGYTASISAMRFLTKNTLDAGMRTYISMLTHGIIELPPHTS
jgi:hypothetical protein